jgi:hypothetical protein
MHVFGVQHALLLLPLIPPSPPPPFQTNRPTATATLLRVREALHLGPRKRRLVVVVLVGGLLWLGLGHPRPAASKAPGHGPWAGAGMAGATDGNHTAADPHAVAKAKIRAHFADVLIIVHYNHNRFETNVDQWNALYGEYFPHSVIYGPGTWEESEDVNITRMAEIHPYGDYFPGRMPGSTAYNTNYMAIKQHPGYRGYLWMHFDVWMNLSSLVRFDKDRVWGPSAACKWGSKGLDEECEGWHWCPSTGLEACRKGIAEVHEHWAEWTGEEPGPPFTRCEAAASDALYLPATKLDLYFKVAEVFLRLYTFLEIAVPQIARFLNQSNTTNEEWNFQFGINKDDIRDIAERGGACKHEELHGLDLAHAMNLKDPAEVRKLRGLVEQDLWRLEDWTPATGGGGGGH